MFKHAQHAQSTDTCIEIMFMKFYIEFAVFLL